MRTLCGWEHGFAARMHAPAAAQTRCCGAGPPSAPGCAQLPRASRPESTPSLTRCLCACMYVLSVFSRIRVSNILASAVCGRSLQAAQTVEEAPASSIKSRCFIYATMRGHAGMHTQMQGCSCWHAHANARLVMLACKRKCMVFSIPFKMFQGRM
jgi:hypothetical protein